MADVLERARNDLRDGQRWKARQRLEGYVGSMGYHRDVLEMLGRVCWEMGDVPAAGRFWFFTALDRPEKRTAVETFARLHGSSPVQLARSLPKRLRHTRRSRLPAEVIDRLAALDRLAPPKLPKPDTRPHGGPRRVNLLYSLDAVTLVFGMGLATFFLLCFSLGLAQLLGL